MLILLKILTVFELWLKICIVITKSDPLDFLIVFEFLPKNDFFIVITKQVLLPEMLIVLELWQKKNFFLLTRSVDSLRYFLHNPYKKCSYASLNIKFIVKRPRLCLISGVCAKYVCMSVKRIFHMLNTSISRFYLYGRPCDPILKLFSKNT